MTEKDFIKLADYIRNSNEPFNEDQIARLADFCRDGNPKFKRERWLGYAEHLPENRTTFGSAVVVEHRYIADIVGGIRADGLEVL
jgi:hypothetical protein